MVIVQSSVSTYVFTGFEINCSQNLHVGLSMSQGTCMCTCIYQNHQDFCMHQAFSQLQVLIIQITEFINMPGWVFLKTGMISKADA